MIKASKGRLLGCIALLQKLTPKFLDECNHHIPGNAKGLLSLEVCLAYRAKETQEMLYWCGRDKDGKVIDWNAWRSNAHWDESFHSFLPDGLCCAIDTGIYNAETKEWTWPEPKARADANEEQKAKAAAADLMWKTFAEIARDFGLFSGYRWKRKDGSPLDPGHFHLNLGLKAKELRDYLGDSVPGVIQGVITSMWEKANPEAAVKLSAILL